MLIYLNKSMYYIFDFNFNYINKYLKFINYIHYINYLNKKNLIVQDIL